jgi:sugar phosphate permease
MLALMVAGEGIFLLPFVVARVFRPTLLTVYGIDNFQLGTAMSVYGLVALAAYFLGGPLADRFQTRRLMCVALVSTALGGLYFTTVPSLNGLKVLFGFWGVSTILPFWAAMIRATRLWGGSDSQGKAFGILDGGRGLVAAVLASVSVMVFSLMLPEENWYQRLSEASPASHLPLMKALTVGFINLSKPAALVSVIWIFSGVTLSAAALVWFCVPEDESSAGGTEDRIRWAMIRPVLKNPSVWLQGMIVVCAYVGYKGTDDLGLYAKDVFNFDDVEAAQLGTLSFWIRPIAAIGAGFVGDRMGHTRAMIACFTIMLMGYLAVALGLLQPTATWMLIVMVIGTGAAVFGVRSLYFAIFSEAGIPPALTGTAVGVVSVVGYTPDVFLGPVMGYCTETYPGELGHQYLFGIFAAFATAGLLCTLAFRNMARKRAL